MSNNSGIICRITNVRSHPNGDRIRLGTASGYQVVIGLDIVENQMGIYFPTDTCLGIHFSEANPDLLTYFGANRRVRTQKFRGERSEGFWCPIETLAFTGATFTEGQEVEKLGEFDICRKYINPATLQKRSQSNKLPKKLRSGSLPTFQKHLETSHLRKHIKELNGTAYNEPNWVWTYKLHGTSQRVGHVLTPIEVTIISRCTRRAVSLFNTSLRSMRIPVSKYAGHNAINISEGIDRWLSRIRVRLGYASHQYEYLIGTRNVIIGEVRSDQTIGADTFYSDEFRHTATKPFINNLHKGEVVYYEVVGYSSTSTPIMGTVTVKDRELKKLYSDQVVYTYGCVPGQCDIYVYRIAYQTVDGESIDLTWDQVKRRCAELGVKHVPEAVELNQRFNESKQMDLEAVEWIANWIEQPDPIDSRHPLEGVVLRIDSSRPEFFKEKAFTFKVLEGIAKDSGTVDLEDAS